MQNMDCILTCGDIWWEVSLPERAGWRTPPACWRTLATPPLPADKCCSLTFPMCQRSRTSVALLSVPPCFLLFVNFCMWLMLRELFCFVFSFSLFLADSLSLQEALRWTGHLGALGFSRLYAKTSLNVFKNTRRGKKIMFSQWHVKFQEESF